MNTDLTVAAVVEKDGRFLIVEESVSGRLVLTQPGGHIETGESPEAAVCREVFEESACNIEVDYLIGVYLWPGAQPHQQFLRLVYAAQLLGAPRRAPPDRSIRAVHWFSRDALERRRNRLRSPTVIPCIDDYQHGVRHPTWPAGLSQPRSAPVHARLIRAR